MTIAACPTAALCHLPAAGPSGRGRRGPAGAEASNCQTRTDGHVRRVALSDRRRAFSHHPQAKFKSVSAGPGAGAYRILKQGAKRADKVSETLSF